MSNDSKGNNFFPFDFASMMQAWQNLSQGAMQNTIANASEKMLNPLPKPEDLQKKIDQLEIVENWLKANTDSVSSQIALLKSQKSAIEAATNFTSNGLNAQNITDFTNSAVALQDAAKLNMQILSHMQEMMKGFSENNYLNKNK